MAGTGSGRGADASTPDDVVGFTTPAPTASRQPHLVEALAHLLGSTPDPREALLRLVKLGQAASGAHHCSVFVVEDGHLVPVVAVGRNPDPAKWGVFRSMDPIELDDQRMAVLRVPEPVTIERAWTSTLIPLAWRERFRPETVVLAPIHADGRPTALLAFDWSELRPFSTDTVSVVRAVASFAGVAIGNARLYESTRKRMVLQEALARGTAALASCEDVGAVVQCAVDAFADVLGPSLSAVVVVDPERGPVTAMAVRDPADAGSSLALAGLPDVVLNRVLGEWAGITAPREVANDPLFPGLVVPLATGGEARGAAFLALDPAHSLDDDDRAALDSLTGAVNNALRRCRQADRLQRRVRELETVARAGAVLGEGGRAERLAAEVNAVLGDLGVEATGIAFSDEVLIQRLGGDTLDAGEAAAWHGKTSEVTANGRLTALVVPLGDERAMALRLRGADELDLSSRATLLAMARGLADVARRESFRAAREEAARDEVLAADRERMAVDLHDTCGYMFWAIKLLASELAERLEPELAEFSHRLAEFADNGRRQLDEVARALAFLPAVRRGLVVSLRELAEEISGDSGLDIDVTVDGHADRLDPDVERSLYRIGHEALVNAWRHGRCESVQVTVTFGEGEVVLRVADDGVGCAPEGPVEGVGLSGMQKAAKAAGGSLTFGCGDGDGFVVEVRAPRKRGDA